MSNIEEDMKYFIQDIDILINNIINIQEPTATGIVVAKQPLILKIYRLLRTCKGQQERIQELELKQKEMCEEYCPKTARIKELEEENKNILNSKIGIDLSYDDYIPKQKVKDKIKEIKEDKESKYFYRFLTTRDIDYAIEILENLLEDK